MTTVESASAWVTSVLHRVFNFGRRPLRSRLEILLKKRREFVCFDQRRSGARRLLLCSVAVAMSKPLIELSPSADGLWSELGLDRRHQLGSASSFFSGLLGAALPSM